MSSNMTNGSIGLIPSVQPDHWLVERMRYAARELSDCVEINPGTLGGVPVLKGTRISVAQILAELGEGHSVEDISCDFELDAELVKKLVTGLALCLDRPIGS